MALGTYSGTVTNGHVSPDAIADVVKCKEKLSYDVIMFFALIW